MSWNRFRSLHMKEGGIHYSEKDGEHTDYDDMELLPKMVHDGFYDGILSFREDSANVYFRRFWRLYLDGSYEDVLTKWNRYDRWYEMHRFLERLSRQESDTGEAVSDFQQIEIEFAEAYEVTDDVVRKTWRRREYNRERRIQHLYDLPNDRPILNLRDLKKGEHPYADRYTTRKLEKHYHPDNYTKHRLNELKGNNYLREHVLILFQDWLFLEYNDENSLVDFTNEITGLLGLGELRMNMLIDVLIDEVYDDVFRDDDEEFIDAVVDNYNKELQLRLTLDEIKPHFRFKDRTKEMEGYIRRKRIERMSKNPALRGYYDNWSMNK